MTTLKFNNIEYIEIRETASGDYTGYGSIGIANYRIIMADAADNAWEDMQISEQVIREFCERTSDDAARRYFAEWTDIRPAGAELITLIDAGKAPHVLKSYADYGYNCLWLRSDIAGDYVASLEKYPCLDDEMVSEVELEQEQEAWESWVKSDLMRGIDLDDEPDDDILWECYRAAMDETNEYPVSEYAGVYVDVERISGAFHRLLKSKLAA